jgi:hypothetical protein
MTARSGAFNNGSLTVRRNTDGSDNLGKEFAILRDEAADNNIEQLDKTVDVVNFHYQTAGNNHAGGPPLRTKISSDIRSLEAETQALGRSLAESSRQSG